MEALVPIIGTPPETPTETPISIIGLEEPEPEQTPRDVDILSSGRRGWGSNTRGARPVSKISGDENQDPEDTSGTGSEGDKKGKAQPPPKWSKNEDALLLRFVRENGKVGWARIGRILGRKGKQCRNRFYNAIDPELSAKEWTVEEDQRIVELHQRFGCRWALLARNLPGRGQNAIKNHWNCIARSCCVAEDPTIDKRGAPSPLREYIASLPPSVENPKSPTVSCPSLTPSSGEPPLDWTPPLGGAVPKVVTPPSWLPREMHGGSALGGGQEVENLPPLKKQKSNSPGAGEETQEPKEERQHSALRLDQISQWIKIWANPQEMKHQKLLSPQKETSLGGAHKTPPAAPLTRTTSGFPERRLVEEEALLKGGSLDSSKKRNRGGIETLETERFGGGVVSGWEDGSSKPPVESTEHFDWREQLPLKYAATLLGQTSGQTIPPSQNGLAPTMPLSIPLGKPSTNGGVSAVEGSAQKRPWEEMKSTDASYLQGVRKVTDGKDESDILMHKGGGREGSGCSGDSTEHFDWKAQWAKLNARHGIPDPPPVLDTVPLEQAEGDAKWEEMVSGVPGSFLARCATDPGGDALGTETYGGSTLQVELPPWEVSEGHGGGEDHRMGPPVDDAPPAAMQTETAPLSRGSLGALMREMSGSFRKPPVGATRVLAKKPQVSEMRWGGEVGRLASPASPLCLGTMEGDHFDVENCFFPRMEGSEVPSPLINELGEQPMGVERAPIEPNWTTSRLIPGSELPLASITQGVTAPLEGKELFVGGATDSLPLIPGQLAPGQGQCSAPLPTAAVVSGVGTGQIPQTGPYFITKGTADNSVLTKMVTEHLCSLLEQQAKQFSMVDPANPGRLDTDQVLKLREHHTQMRAAISFLSSLTRSANPGEINQEAQSKWEAVDDTSMSLDSPATPGSASSPTPYAGEGNGRRPKKGGGALNGVFQVGRLEMCALGPLEGLQLEEISDEGTGGQANEEEGWHKITSGYKPLGEEVDIAKDPIVDLKPAWVGLEDLKIPSGGLPMANGGEWHQWLDQHVAAVPNPLVGEANLGVHEREEQILDSGDRRSQGPVCSEAEQRFTQCFLTWPDDIQT